MLHTTFDGLSVFNYLFHDINTFYLRCNNCRYVSNSPITEGIISEQDFYIRCNKCNQLHRYNLGIIATHHTYLFFRDRDEAKGIVMYKSTTSLPVVDAYKTSTQTKQQCVAFFEKFINFTRLMEQP